MTKLYKFLEQLEDNNIYYKLNKVRESIMVEIAIPGQRWEVEFFDDEHVEIEKFVSDGTIYDETDIKKLFIYS